MAGEESCKKGFEALTALSIMKAKIAVLIVSAVCVATPGCVQEGQGLSTYSSSMRGQAMQVYNVQIVAVRPVALRGDTNIVGVGAGALAGGIAGSMIGQGRASALTAVGGALAGGLIGNEVGKKATSGRGLEITVRTRSGQQWAVVQADHGENFMIGEQVRMMVGDDKRIIAR